MSYLSQAQLDRDPDFQARVTAAAVQQATIFKDDGRSDFVALSNGLLSGNWTYSSTFVRLAAAAPGIADKADDGDDGVDQSAVTDGDLLASTQANFPLVADLFFTDDGTAK